MAGLATVDSNEGVADAPPAHSSNETRPTIFAFTMNSIQWAQASCLPLRCYQYIFFVTEFTAYFEFFSKPNTTILRNVNLLLLSLQPLTRTILFRRGLQGTLPLVRGRLGLASEEAIDVAAGQLRPPSNELARGQTSSATTSNDLIEPLVMRTPCCRGRISQRPNPWPPTAGPDRKRGSKRVPGSSLRHHPGTSGRRRFCPRMTAMASHVKLPP